MGDQASIPPNLVQYEKSFSEAFEMENLNDILKGPFALSIEPKVSYVLKVCDKITDFK